jgi:hypothetical protein
MARSRDGDSVATRLQRGQGMRAELRRPDPPDGGGLGAALYRQYGATITATRARSAESAS